MNSLKLNIKRAPLVISKFAFALALFTALVASASAAPKYGFCWAQIPSGVNCTAIGPTNLTFPVQCTAWAKAQGASKWGNYRNSSLAEVQAKQIEGCHYVDSLIKYECFIQETCTTTSSIRPAHKAVFAANTTSATSACVDVAAAEFLSALKGLAPDCGVSPQAVATMP
jgi:hypothetical protein